MHVMHRMFCICLKYSQTSILVYACIMITKYTWMEVWIQPWYIWWHTYARMQKYIGGYVCEVCRDKRRHTIELQFIPLHAWRPCRWLVEHHKMIVRRNPLWGSPKLCEEHHIYPTRHECITHKQTQLKPNKSVKRTNYFNNHLWPA